MIEREPKNSMNETDCIQLLENLRWNGIVTSPFVESSKVYCCALGRYKCYDTGRYFNVKTNTMFHNTRIELGIWFQAIEIFLQGEITSVSLAKQLGITQKTAWMMLRKLKKYYNSDDIQYPIAQKKTLVKQGDGKLNLLEWLNRMK